MKTRKLILLACLSLNLIIAASSQSYSQTSDLKTVPKNETVSFLIEQNKNARELISVQENRIAELETEVALERTNSESIGKSYEVAKSEIVSLKSENESLRKAVALNEQTIALLQTDNVKQKEKAKKATRDKWKAYGVAAIAIAAHLLIP